MDDPSYHSMFDSNREKLLEENKKYLKDHNYDPALMAGRGYKKRAEHARRIVGDVLYDSEKLKYKEFFDDTASYYKKLGFDLSDRDVMDAIDAQSFDKYMIWHDSLMQSSEAFAKRYSRTPHLLPKWLREWFIKDANADPEALDLFGYLW